jgi:hypothetical protein
VSCSSFTTPVAAFPSDLRRNIKVYVKAGIVSVVDKVVKVGDILNVCSRTAGVRVAAEDFDTTTDAIIGVVKMAAVAVDL